MENNNDSFNSQGNVNSQFVLSYELLSLLQWIVENDTAKLKKIIAKALQSGLRQELQRADTHSSEIHTTEGAQLSVLEFFGLLESLLQETISEQTIQHTLEKNLMPAIEHIDSTLCDDDTVRLSIEKVSAKLEQFPHKNPQDALFKELLKNWKPTKKMTVN